jgi:hypothetical protein
MTDILHGLAVAVGSPCSNCKGADVAYIEVTGRTHAMRCRTCHADRGELDETTIKFLTNTIGAFGAPPEPVSISHAPQKEPKMKYDDLFPSRFIKASDLSGKPLDVVIKSLKIESMKDMNGGNVDKPVLSFVNQTKSMVLNKTNAGLLVELHGNESDNWPGKRIQLYPTKASLGGRSVDAVRIRSTNADAFDDEIPA